VNLYGAIVKRIILTLLILNLQIFSAYSHEDRELFLRGEVIRIDGVPQEISYYADHKDKATPFSVKLKKVSRPPYPNTAFL